MKTKRNVILFRALVIALVILFAFLLNVQNVPGLTIKLDYNGGAPPTNSIGGGSLTNIMKVAADYWTNVFRDDFTLTISYGWSTNNLLATGHVLNTQGGTPDRETTGTILFLADNNPNHFMYYLDPTPTQNEEYTNYTEGGSNLGGGYVNCSRYFSGGPVGPTGQCVDLKTVAIYEMGHALGMSLANQSFLSAISGGDFIDIAAPRPFAGTVVPIRSNNYGPIANIDYISDFRILMGGSFAPGERVLPSQLDIVALAQISGFTNVDYGMLETNSPVPAINISAPFALRSAGDVSLSWKQPLFGQYEIEECLDLGQANWVPVSTNVVTTEDTNGVYSATVPVSGMSVFFRLKQF